MSSSEKLVFIGQSDAFFVVSLGWINFWLQILQNQALSNHKNRGLHRGGRGRGGGGGEGLPPNFGLQYKGVPKSPLLSLFCNGV